MDPGDWVCVLDADMKCEPHYFVKALGCAVGQQAVPGSRPCHYVLCPQVRGEEGRRVLIVLIG